MSHHHAPGEACPHHEHHEHVHSPGCGHIDVHESDMCSRGICSHIEHMRMAMSYQQQDPALAQRQPAVESTEPKKKKQMTKAEAKKELLKRRKLGRKFMFFASKYNSNLEMAVT